MKPKKKLISIIVPCFNEEKNIQPFLVKIKSIIDKNSSDYNFKLCFIDDGSTDNTWSNIINAKKKYKFIKPIKFIKNFGKEKALLCGLLENKNSDAIIFIDADLQHPPYLINKFIQHWRNGNLIVAGKRVKDNFNFLRNLGSNLFYLLLNKVTNFKIEPLSTDYRLIDKKVINVLSNISENVTFMRGMIDWTGFKVKYINFESDDRISGKSSYNFRYLFSLAMNSFTSFSLFPLRLIGYLGIISFFISIMSIIIYLLSLKFLSIEINIQTLGIMILLLIFSIVFIGMGLLALYIGNIHTEILKRPRYIIDE